MVGAELRKTRLAAKLTQEQVAARAKLTREYINQVENGKKNPTIAVFARICRALGVRASKVLARVEDELP